MQASAEPVDVGTCLAKCSVAVAAARPISGARAVHVHHDQDNDGNDDDDGQRRSSDCPWSGHGITSEGALQGPGMRDLTVPTSQ